MLWRDLSNINTGNINERLSLSSLCV